MRFDMAIDIIIGIVLVVAVVTGAMTGLVRQLGTMVAFVVAVLACRFFGADIARAAAASSADHAQLLSVLCYILVFIVAFVIVLVIARLLHATVSAMKLGAVNRILGALFRLGLWLVVMSACLNVYFAVFPEGESSFLRKERPWRVWTLRAATAVVGYISHDVNL